MKQILSLVFLSAALMTGPAASADPLPLSDLSDPVEADKWRFFTDQVMGGRSNGSAVAKDGAVHLSGTVSTENNGGFIQIRRETRGLPKDAAALVLTVKGDGQTYYAHLRTTDTRLPWQYYQAAFTVDDRWSVVTLPFSAFSPSAKTLPATPVPDAVRSIGLVAYGRDHVADVWLASVHLQ